jgi:hypothetical protein
MLRLALARGSVLDTLSCVAALIPTAFAAADEKQEEPLMLPVRSHSFV